MHDDIMGCIGYLDEDDEREASTGSPDCIKSSCIAHLKSGEMFCEHFAASQSEIARAYRAVRDDAKYDTACVGTLMNFIRTVVPNVDFGEAETVLEHGTRRIQLMANSIADHCDPSPDEIMTDVREAVETVDSYC